MLIKPCSTFIISKRIFSQTRRYDLTMGRFTVWACQKRPIFILGARPGLHMNILTYICCIHIARILKGALKLTDPLCVSKIKSKTPSTVHKHTYFTSFLVYSLTCPILSLLSGMKIAASAESRSVPHYSVTHTHTHM